MKLIIPSTIMKILLNFSCVLTAPTFENIIVLFAGAILTNGARTITNMLRAVRPLVTKSFCSYHRVFSRAEICLFALARILATLLFHLIPGRIELVVDETISRHNGKKVYAQSCHRDKVRSTHKNVCYTFGHYWVVLCVNVHMPFLSRPWALPFMALLWVSEKNCKKYNLKHRTPIELTIIMLKKVSQWFPEKCFIITGDGGFASIVLTRFCKNHPRFELVSRLRKDAQLYALPMQKKTRTRGRPAQKGKRIRSPEQEVAHKNKNKHKWITATVTWYGNRAKTVEYFCNQALVYQPGKGIALISYIIVFDPEDNSFETLFTTDLSLSVHEAIRLFVQRWSIEVTFEEARKFLAIESTRNRKKESVIRSFPFLLGLFSVISLWYFQTFKEHNHTIAQEEWYTKTEPTFADAINAIRHQLWSSSIFSMSTKTDNMIKIDASFVEFITESLARAA
jgi:hypothetical protein